MTPAWRATRSIRRKSRSARENKFQSNRQYPRRLETESRISVLVGVIDNHVPLLHQAEDFVREGVARRWFGGGFIAGKLAEQPA
jgi:hypothetical protein